jgi:hypothetical protein
MPNGRTVHLFPAHRARCSSCGHILRRITISDGDLLATCDGRRDGRRCGQKHYLRGWHGWVAVVHVQVDEWAAVVNERTGEVDRGRLRVLGIAQAAFAALGTLSPETGPDKAETPLHGCLRQKGSRRIAQDGRSQGWQG